MTSIAIIDHGAGNLVSILRALEGGGADVHVVTAGSGSETFLEADGVVLPGVGAMGAAMQRLATADLVEPLRQWPGPLLGICVGMQLLFDGSEEYAAATDNTPAGGLGIIGGQVRQLPDAPLLPHIGWNDVELADHPLTEGIPSGTPFYFVHSFAPVPEEPSVVLGRTSYDSPFTSAVASATRLGVQFHPERSGAAGLRMLANFVDICGRWRDAA